MAGEPDLRRGDSGEWVTYLQQLLRQAGYDVAEDGDFGDYVEEAVKRFQNDRGLTADGVVGQATWDALTGASSGGGGGGASGEGDGIEFDWNDFPTLWEVSQLQTEDAVKQDLIAMGITPPEGDDTEAYA